MFLCRWSPLRSSPLLSLRAVLRSGGGGWAGAMVWLALTACNRRADAPKAAAQPPSTATVAAQPAPPIVTEAAARALLQTWCDTQSQGQFDAFGLLYARRMTAIRQAQGAARLFDRAAWLAERRKRFAQAARVEVRDVQVQVTANLVLLEFSESGEARPAGEGGRTRMVLIPEDKALRIAREERLDTAQPPAIDLAAAPSAEQLAWVVAAGDQTWLVVGTPGPARSEETRATPLLLSRGPQTVAVRPLRDGPPPPWRQRDVVLYGEAGEACRGTVDAAGLLAQIRPHASQIAAWSAVPGDRGPAADTAIAREVVTLAGRSLTAAVRVKPWQGDCRGAVWGRASNLPPARVFEHGIAPGGYIREEPLTALRALPGYQAVQRDFGQRVPPPRPAYWDQLDHSKAQVHVFAGHGRRFAVVHAKVGNRCSGFAAEQLAMFGVQEPVRDQLVLQRLTGDAHPHLQLPVSAADVDGDGEPELIAPTQVWRKAGAVWRPVLTLTIPEFDSPC